MSVMKIVKNERKNTNKQSTTSKKEIEMISGSTTSTTTKKNAWIASILSEQKEM